MYTILLYSMCYIQYNCLVLLGLFFVSYSEVNCQTDIETNLEKNIKVYNCDLKYYFLSLKCQCCYLRQTQRWKPAADILLES